MGFVGWAERLIDVSFANPAALAPCRVQRQCGVRTTVTVHGASATTWADTLPR
jgi:hypothetical protein